MNIISFTYTKKDGKKSERVISPIIIPNKMYEGTDISELNVDDQVLYCQQLGKLNDEYRERIERLNCRFDIENRYRRFDPSKMTEIIEEAV